METHGRSLDILEKKRTVDLLNQALGADDEVRFVLQNGNGWAVVALADRVVIARFGMAAGSTFGGRLSQFRYEDILNVNQNTALVSAVIELHTPAHQGNAVGDFWSGFGSSGTSKSPFEADNAFPCSKANLKEWGPYLEELSGYIRQARTPARSSSVPNDGIGDQLTKVADLHTQGLLSDDEFRAAKAKLLGS